MNLFIYKPLEPRIPGIRTVPIEGFTNGPIIIIRVPKSWNSPHMVVFKNLSRFFARNSAGKYQLDVTEIRSSFVASESLAERIRQFRTDRIAKILADETPIPLRKNPKIALHVLPLESFSSGMLIDTSWFEDNFAYLKPINSDNLRNRYNFDGFCNYCAYDQNQPAYSYTQIFRNGLIEAVDLVFLRDVSGKMIPGDYERELIKALKNYLELYRRINVNLPVLVALSLLEVKGYRMSTNMRPVFLDIEQDLIDRDHLLIPEILVESYDAPAEEILRPAFDAVWQACGYSHRPLAL